MKLSDRTEQLINADLEYIIHPAGLVGQPDLNRVLEKAYGIYVEDTEGKQYIDLSSQLMCVNLGHGQKKIQAAVKEAIDKTDYTTTYWGLGNPYNIECAQKLAKITPGNLNHFYFTCGGGESVDAAIKVARMYWHYQGRTEKRKIVSLYNAYHGTTGIAVSATTFGGGMYHVAIEPVTPGFLHIAPPYCYRCFHNLTYPGCDVACARYLEKVITSEGAASIAGFIAEGIQGAGGVIDPPPEWWPLIRKICTDHEVILIEDEVMSGFARTGKMFAIEHYDVIPDVMVMAKGISNAALPFGAVAVSDEIYAVLKGKMFGHGTTYAGHPVCSAASVAALELYEELNVVENANKVGKHIRERLDNEFSPLPCVGDIGGKGMFQGIEIVANKDTKQPPSKALLEKLRYDLWDKGIVLREAGLLMNRLIVAPPCTMTIDEADKALDIVYSVIAGLRPA